MPTIQLSMGVVLNPMVQNQVYALPYRACYVFSQGTAPTISNDGSTFGAIPASNIVAAAFIKSTGADTILELKGV